MKYILMMSATKAGVGTYHTWSPKDAEAHMECLRTIVKELTDFGEFVATQGLAEPAEAKLVSAKGLTCHEQAKLVRGGKDGAPITDGVFPESKEFLAGFWIVDVDTAERAYAIAAEVSAAPGPGGAALSMPIEVRPIMSAPS